jgi:hypothetical protein
MIFWDMKTCDLYIDNIVSEGLADSLFRKRRVTPAECGFQNNCFQ